VWFFGPPYLPIIPIFNYFETNKKTKDYYIMLSLEKSNDTLEGKHLKFLHNEKEVVPKEICEIEFKDKEKQDKYVINSKWTSDSIYYCSLQSPKIYFIVFNLNKNKLKSIEMRYRDSVFINIQRKKKWYHSISFAH
jgi:uncharacterized protein YtpQ (UPF0354 family)